MNRIDAAWVIAAMLMTVSCGSGDGATDPTTGSLEVSVSTSGVDIPDSYTVSLDSTLTRTISANGDVTFQEVSAGNHVVQLELVPSNCPG